MTVRAIERPMKLLAVRALIAVLILAPLAAPLADAAPTSFTINVVSTRSLGCSPDFFTSPDLRARVLVNGVAIGTTPEATDQAEPVYGWTITASANLPAVIGVEVDEAEPAGFFGTSTTYIACTLAPGNATRAQFTYNGETSLPLMARGDGEKAAEVVMVVGIGAPSAPAVSFTTTTSNATLSWNDDATGQATGHRIAYGSAGGILGSASAARNATVYGLCDNKDYTFRVIRDTPTWHVTSADVTLHTANAPPNPPTMLSAQGENVTFESTTTHDIARYEVHASWNASFTPSDQTLRKTITPTPLSYSRVDATGVPFTASDVYVIARAVDTGGLRADSLAFTRGSADRESSGSFSQCGSATMSASPPTPVFRPTPVWQPTPSPAPAPARTEPTPGPTPAPVSPMGRICCYLVNVTIERSGDPWPTILSGETVDVTLRNEGEVAVTFDLQILANSEPITFEPGPTGITLGANASMTRAIKIQAVAGTPAKADVGAQIVPLVRSDVQGVVRAGSFLVDIPVDLASQALSALIDVKPEAGPFRVPPGGTAEARVLLVNRADHAVTIEAILAPAWRNDSDIGRPVVAHGFQASPSILVLDLAPYSKQNLTVLLTAPLNATIGETVDAELRFRASSSAKAEALRPALFAMEVAPPSATVAASASADANVKLAAVAVGATATAGAAAFVVWARRDAARYALGVALYARLARSELLEHSGRDALRERIVREPGVCYSDLKAASGMNTGAIVHHLRALERGGFITSRKEGAFRRFYPIGAAPPVQAGVATVTALTPTQSRVLALLREAPLTQGELAGRLGLSQQGTSHHVKSLERAGHIAPFHDGSAWRYRVVEPASPYERV